MVEDEDHGDNLCYTVEATTPGAAHQSDPGAHPERGTVSVAESTPKRRVMAVLYHPCSTLGHA